MAIPLVVNGVTYQYPVQFDKNWAPTLTAWSQAVTNGMLQKAGGSFPLTAEVDFGASFGMKVLSIKSEESNIATTGFLRLANASTGIAWRNAANNANLALTVNASNQLTFNGTNVGATTALTSGHILVGNASNQPADVAMSGDTTIDNTGAVTIANSAVTNAKIAAAAAIARSKIASGTANTMVVNDATGVMSQVGLNSSVAVVTDASGLLTSSATTSTEIGRLSGVTSSVQTQLNSMLQKAGGTMSGVLNMGSNKIQALTQGTSAGEAVAVPVGTAQLAANAVTQFVQTLDSNTNVASTTTIASATITTTGGPVLIMGNVSMVLAAGDALNVVVNRDSASLTHNRRRLANGGTSSSTMNASVTMFDSPAAGTYTYRLGFDGGGSQGTSGFSLVLIELKA